MPDRRRIYRKKPLASSKPVPASRAVSGRAPLVQRSLGRPRAPATLASWHAIRRPETSPTTIWRSSWRQRPRTSGRATSIIAARVLARITPRAFVTWAVDFTTNARTDLVGLDPEVSEVITDVLVAWAQNGPLLGNRRELGGMVYYESTVAERYLLGYSVRADQQAFVVLWLRRTPGDSR